MSSRGIWTETVTLDPGKASLNLDAHQDVNAGDAFPRARQFHYETERWVPPVSLSCLTEIALTLLGAQDFELKCSVVG